MAACNLSYTSSQGNRLDMEIDLKYYLKSAGNNVDAGITNFINQYVHYNPSNQQVKLVPSSADSESDVDKSLRALYNDLESVVQSMSSVDANTAEKILSSFRNAMSIIDNSQEAKVFSEEELLPQKELEDRNTRNLQRHLDDFYGRDALNITEGMRLDFTDRIATATYYNITTGRLVKQDNVQLNQRILAQKERLFEDIVHYLQRTHGNDQTVMKLSDKLIRDGEIDIDNYNVAMNKFYALEVAPDPDSFKKKLQKDNADEIRGNARKNRKNAYESLVDEMLKDDKFAEHAKRKYGKTYGLDQLRTQLYVGDHYSQYYGFIQEYINKSMESSDPNVVAQAREWNQKLKDIDQSTQSLLDIANAYTMLRHFDSLLKDTGGKQISIKRGLQGINTSVPDKYSYSHDTEHECKGWNTSEKIGSEKHTSKLTETVLKLIRIYDWRTDEFMNRRVDPTVFIMSMQKLRDAIINGTMTFHGNEKAAEEIREVAINLMDDPIGNMQRLLELMFEKQGRAKTSLAKSRIDKGSSYSTLTDLDLSILKSIYDIVFNKNNEYSFYMQSIRAGIWDPAAQSLLREIAGYAIRNNTIDYLETDYDVDTGTPNVVRKKKFFTNRPLRMLQVRINNHLNRKSDLAREYLQNEYNAASASDPNDGKRTIYTVNVKGMNLKLSIPNSNSYQILAIDYSNESAVEFTIDGKQSLFADIDKIDLSEFRMKINENKTLNTNEQLLYNLLKFIDDNLNMGILNDIGLQTLYTFKQIYQKIDNQPYYIMPLLKLAMRAAYANSKYYEAQEETLGHYLDKTNDSVYKYHQGTIGSRVFTNRFNDVKYRIASYRDKVLEMWIDAASILNGDASKSTTKDRQGNTIPNNTVSKLGSNLAYYLGKQRRNIDDASAWLMFTSRQNAGMLKGTYHDLEITSIRGDTKSIRQLSVGELVYHAIFNKFYGPWNSRKTLIIQPTVYSDKTTYMNWEIDPTAWEDSHGRPYNLMDLPIIDTTGERTSLIDVYLDTLGQFYKNIHETTTAKLDAIAKTYVQSHQELKNSSTRDILATMSENDLVKTAASIGQEVELNKDYVIVKRNGRNVVAMNGMLEYNSKLYNDRDMLIKHLRGQETAFVGQLLDNGCAYQVLTGNDTLDMYTGDKQISSQARSKNPILRTILETQSTDRAEYMKKWVDADTGKLILAKQDGHNILSLSDAFDRSRDVELNPLLQRFFHVESLLSNNLRMSLTGSEINHPPRKGKNVLTSASAANTISEWNSLGIGMTFDAENAEDVIAFGQLHNEEKTGLLDNDKVLTIDDLNVLIAKANSYTPRVREALTALRDSLGQFIANTSQGTQFKRNVIIPATLQYCVQQDKEGPPPQVRCAVIRDEGAPVWNYRGDRESDIDACDGNAKITAWQCIMENRSLGSQSVGFVKKPIWHSYDTKGGTAFLAKFATDTLTNELMRTSLLSKTNLYNLFKKATNLQWDPEDNIDLTKGIDRRGGYEEGVENDENDEKLAKSMHELWFKSMILGNQRLFHKDKYGDIKEIVDLGKRTSHVGEGQGTYYFTKEEDAYGNEYTKFHLFYDEGSGVASKSIHLTFDTLQQLLKVRNDLAAEGKNPHTINSLFELYTALGGLNCVDKDGNDSEYNNEVMVNFMCNIGGLKPDVKQSDAKFTSQKTHDQPLKKYHIGYMFNATAVKNGAKNINPSEAWSNDEELSTFMVDFDGFGIQMNADHEIIDSELTEFSQVVAACAAYGYTFNNCRELFHSLAQTALQASKAMIDATDAFLAEIKVDDKAKVISDLYDAVGRIFFMEHVIKDRQSLENIIIQGVRKVFDKNSNHTHDSKKMPFSDPNIYNTFISTLASTITKRSIKRKHPGSGSVMVPAYNMMQYFEVANDKGRIEKIFAPALLERARSDYRNDIIEFLKTQNGYNDKSNTLVINDLAYPLGFMQLGDLVKLAIKIDPTGSFSDYYNDIEDATTSNQMLMHTYLEKNAPKHKKVTDAEYFMPSDSVDVLDEDGNVVETITLDSMDKYIKFLDDVEESKKRKVGKKIDDNGAIDYMLSINEEAAAAGTSGEWREFLSTLYPDSKVKTVYWHGTNSDFSGGFDTAQRTAGSGAPETRNEMYFAKQPWAVLQYITGVNRDIPELNTDDKKEYNNWVKLWWGLNQIIGNKWRAEHPDDPDGWMKQPINDALIGDGNIPNKAGIFDLEHGHGSTLRDRKGRYKRKGKKKGEETDYSNARNKTFFKEVFDLEYGDNKNEGETFEQWVNKNAEKFKKIWEKRAFPAGQAVPVLINAANPYEETGQTTYYQDRGVFGIEGSVTSQNQNDVVLSNNAANEFHSDVAIVLNPTPENIHFIGSRQSIDAFKQWKREKRFPKNCKFRISATTPQNLKPSLIRWKYKDKNGQVRTMNYFALKHVRDAYINEDPNYTKTRAYRKQVQDVLQGLHEGHFTGNDGVEYDIIPGTLENMEAELVMGNIYKDTFGIGNESLNEVMAKGEAYFHDKISRLAAPKNMNYDIAFLREKGSHTLISLSPVEEGRLVDENPFTNTMTTKEGEIYAVKNGRQLFKIGKWVNIDPEKDGISYEASTQKFLSDKGVNIDQSQYRIYNGQEGNTVVQKRVDFVKRYRMLIKKPLSGGGVSYETNTLYEMASLEDIMSAFSDNPRMRDAINQRSAIITAIYKASDYKMVQVNDLKALTMPEKIKSKDLHNTLDYLADGDDFDDNNRALIHSQIHGIEELEKIGKPTEEQRNKYLKEVQRNKKEFLGKEAHRQWVSFQDSVKFIAARIPAQSLQSFMAMRLVGWTGNNMNMCYVSHFQTYLQGSDYDIDKAYVMGQNYDSNGIYVKWSPLFDYTSLQTLEASKKLPVPKGLNVQRTNLEGADMTREIIDLSKLTAELKEHGNQKLSTKGKKEEDKVKFLNIMCNVLRKLEDNGGKWYFNRSSEEAKDISDQFLEAFKTTLIRHEHYQAPESVAEESSKNAASANIYAVAHDIRNRDQAYTAVAMNDLRKAAERTPKGEQSAALSMTNPLTKYIMQYQNMAGKSVVGIAANGEKFWFNAYYYCTDALINRPDSELRYLKFAHTFNMIKGRAKGTKFDPELAKNTVNHLPDLDIRNEKIRQRLLDVFGVDPDSEIPHYVDQLISQLLSAATDNAKELILAKLNADANFAKMYLYLMTMGENVNDIAAFMTSPLAEFVTSRAASNIFQGDAVFNTPNTAIQAALGKVYANNFIHGRMYVPDPSPDANENDVVSRAKTVVVRSVFMDNLRVRGKEAIDMISRYLELGEDDILEKQDLDDLMGALIICSLRSPETFSKGGEAFSIKNFMGKMNDVEMNNYITYCQDLYNQLSNVISQYEKQLEKLEPIDPITKEKKTIPSTRSDAVNYYLRDVDNFKRAYELSDEMSNISVGLLKLNQGLPSSELEFLQRLSQIKKIITSREKALGIKTDCFNEKLNEDSRTRALNKMLDAIIENNPLLLEGVREDDPEGIQAVRDQITSVLERANKAGMMGGGFESIRMLIDDDYRNLAREYLHYIKGTFNAIDMVYNIPHYASIMNCFKAFAVANSALVAKSRLIDRLTADEDYLNDAKLKGAIRYVDKLNAVDFLAQQDPFIPHKSVMGFDALFADKMVSSFDLSTAEGLASFRKFMETDFLDYLREKYPNNSLVPHLMLTEQSGGTLLSTDTDLMNPDATAASKIAFQEILTGMSDFAKIKYENSDLTIADVFQLYNIMMNGDQYGAERLTVTFQAGMNANCVLQKYHDFLSRQDSNPGYISDYERFDYYINAAPLITARAESMHSEPFVKVKDPVWDYIVKVRNSTGGGYSEYPMLPALSDRKIDPIEQNRRRANFIEYCPVEMPVKLKNLSVLGTLNFDKNTDNVDIENEELLKKIEVLLTDMTMSNKAVLYKEC